jgi:hypothetical protein
MKIPLEQGQGTLYFEKYTGQDQKIISAHGK